MEEIICSVENNYSELFVGAFLAFLATLVSSLAVELWKDYSTKRTIRYQVAQIFTQELGIIQGSLEQIKKNYESTRYFSLPILNLLIEDIRNLQNIRNQTIAIDNFFLQDKYIKALVETRSLINRMHSLEQFKLSETSRLQTEITNSSDKSSLVIHLKNLDNLMKEQRGDILSELNLCIKRNEDLLDKLKNIKR